ncbi:MAG: M2 family metallopeptidase [Longimicrobiaceae bacterium]
MSGAGVPWETPESEAQLWVDTHTARVAPLHREANLAEWQSATTGTEAAADRLAEARLALKRVYSDADAADRVREWLEGDEVRDPLLRRQLVLLDHEYRANALSPETLADLTEREAELDRVFNTFRAELEGERVTNNRILEILREEDDNERRRAAWEASKQIGGEVAEPLRELVRRRNAAARSLGYPDYYRMQLELQEIDPERLFALLNDFERRTEPAFRSLRDEQDRALAKRFGLAPEALRPWHWADPFAQRAPGVGGVDLDGFFADRQAVPVAADFFRDLGLPVDDVLARSDLLEREGKSQHGFCIDVDRSGDVRVLCNLRPDEFWMHVLLHELGHAAYDKYLPGELPFLLRAPAHTLTTEAIAMYAGRLTRDPDWLREVLDAPLDDRQADEVRAQQRAELLGATRWMLVMAHFERALYEDPDRDDLNAFWWELVERFQKIRAPDDRDEPDWAAKIHLALAPVYYHNYLLGELMASQLTAAAGTRPGEGNGANKDAGRFFRERVFAAGASERWDELVADATGEELSPKYFIQQFVTSQTVDS